MDAQDVLDFWFNELEPKQHFDKDAALDETIRERFAATHAQAARGELAGWRDTADGRLAEIIVLDQFSRNLFRDSPRAFACDGMALVLALEAVRAGAAQELPRERRAFLYMPYEHSESARIHETALELFSRLGLKRQFKYERAHKAIIDRFGRYPHRNAALGRESTVEEKEFLKQPGSSF